MGQYYRPVIGDAEGKVIDVYTTAVILYKDGMPYIENEGAKLMEHAYWDVVLPNGISKLIYNNPLRVAWVGDYAEGSDFLQSECKQALSLLKTDVWESVNCPNLVVAETDFRLDLKFLVNHDLNQYVNLREYAKLSRDGGYTIHPLPLLTAIGNGKGGGDYRGVNSKLVGKYAWHLLSIVDEKPQGMTKFEVFFKED